MFGSKAQAKKKLPFRWFVACTIAASVVVPVWLLIVGGHFGLATRAAAPPIVVGIAPTNRPFEYIDASGQIAGFGPDLIARLFEEDEYVFYIIDDFEAIPEILNDGHCDLVIASITITSEREDLVSFSTPYLGLDLAILASTDYLARERFSSRSLGNKKWIASFQESVATRGKPSMGDDDDVRAFQRTSDKWVEYHFSQERINGGLSSEYACALSVATNDSAIWINDIASVARFSAEFPDTTRGVYPSEAADLQREDWAIAMRHPSSRIDDKRDRELENRVNSSLQELRSGGRASVIWDLIEKHLGSDLKAIEARGDSKTWDEVKEYVRVPELTDE